MDLNGKDAQKAHNKERKQVMKAYLGMLDRTKKVRVVKVEKENSLASYIDGLKESSISIGSAKTKVLAARLALVEDLGVPEKELSMTTDSELPGMILSKGLIPVKINLEEIFDDYIFLVPKDVLKKCIVLEPQYR
jgi:hypothetical protein